MGEVFPRGGGDSDSNIQDGIPGKRPDGLTPGEHEKEGISCPKTSTQGSCPGLLARSGL